MTDVPYAESAYLATACQLETILIMTQRGSESAAAPLVIHSACSTLLTIPVRFVQDKNVKLEMRRSRTISHRRGSVLAIISIT